MRKSVQDATIKRVVLLTSCIHPHPKLNLYGMLLFCLVQVSIQIPIHLELRPFGQHRAVISCSICHKKSISFEPFSVITLSFPVSGEGSLVELLHHHYRENTIEYRCPSCKTKSNITQKIEIWHLPPILVLHLNRFEYNVTMRKKQSYVDFPLECLDLAAYTAREDIKKFYELNGVSNHYGTMNRGHYTSYCRSNKKWYELNDDKVSVIAASNISSSAACILFYKVNNSVQEEG